MALPTSERVIERAGGDYEPDVFLAQSGSFYKGHVVGIDGTGYLKHIEAGVRPCGICEETKTVSATGVDSVKFSQGEYWFANSATNTVSASHVMKQGYAEIASNTYTVGSLGGTYAFLGQITKVDSAKGVRVKVSLKNPVSGTII